MKKIFEDEFMDLQSEFISLCLDFAEIKVDKVFAYASIEEKSKMFNAFFEVNGEIKTINQFGKNNKLVMQFLRIGTVDLDRIIEVCEKYNMPTPTQMKMYYDANTGKFNAQYQYVEICSAKTGKDAGSIFLDWLSEIRKQST